MPPLDEKRQRIKEALVGFTKGYASGKKETDPVKALVTELENKNVLAKADVLVNRFTSTLSTEQMDAVLKAALSEKDYAALETRFTTVFPKKFRHVISATTHTDSVKYNSLTTKEDFLSKAKELGLTKVVADIEADNKFNYLQNETFYANMEKIADEFLPLIPDDELDAFEKEMKNAGSDLFRDEADIKRTHQRAAEIEELKKNVSDEKTLSDLDYANEMLIRVSPDYAKDLSMDMCKALSKKNRLYMNSALENKNVDPGIRNVVGEIEIKKAVPAEKIEEFSRITENPQLSENTKDAMRQIFALFDEMVPECHTINFEAEQGTKSYGFFELDDSLTELKNAVISKDTDKISAAADRVRKAEAHIDELIKICDTHFDQDYGCPANVDIARRSELPPKYTRDFIHASQINGAFITYSFLRKNGIDREAFLADPEKYYNEVRNKLIKTDLDYTSRARYPDGSPMKLYDALFTLTANPPMPDSVLFAYRDDQVLATRSIEFLCSVETDPEVKENLTVYSTKLNIQELTLMEARKEKTRFIQKTNDEKLQYEIAEQTIANLMLFGDGERDYSALVVAPDTRDPNTMQLREPFDRKKYLAGRPVDLAQLRDRMRETLLGYEMKQDEYPRHRSEEDVIYGAERLAKDIVAARPDMENDPAMKDIKKIAADPEKELKKWCRSRMEEINKDADRELKATQKAILAEEKAYEKAIKTEKDPLVLRSLKNERLTKLMRDYAEGKIPERYFTERSRQVFHGISGKLPPFFEADDFPSASDYAKTQGLEELSEEEAKGIRTSALERAKLEKENFVYGIKKRIGLGESTERDVKPEEILIKNGVFEFATEAEFIENKLYSDIKELDPEKEEIQELGKDTDLEASTEAVDNEKITGSELMKEKTNSI